MRIAIIVDTFPNISETFISNKVVEFTKRGHIVAVFCVKKNHALAQTLFKKGSVDIIVLNFKKFAFFYITHPLLTLFWINGTREIKQGVFRKMRANLINQFRPDIVHFEFSGIGVDYLQEIPMLEGKKIVSCRGSAEKVKLLLYDERKEKFRNLMDKVHKVHCVSIDMATTISPYCENATKIFINYPSIDTAYFKRVNRKREDDCKIVLSVGRITLPKGYTNALLAINKLRDAGILFNWVVVGNGDKEEELKFKIHQLGLANEVLLVGSKTKAEVKSLMEQSDVYYLPSIYEGMANVVLEAMSLEMPVVSTACGGMPEVIQHEFDGLLTPIFDYGDHARCLYKLLTEKAFADRIGKNARKKVIERYSLQMQIDIFEKEYSKLLEVQ